MGQICVFCQRWWGNSGLVSTDPLVSRYDVGPITSLIGPGWEGYVGFSCSWWLYMLRLAQGQHKTDIEGQTRIPSAQEGFEVRHRSQVFNGGRREFPKRRLQIFRFIGGRPAVGRIVFRRSPPQRRESPEQGRWSGSRVGISQYRQKLIPVPSWGRLCLCAWPSIAVAVWGRWGQ